MFKGLSTLEAYERCISEGLCDKHFIDFEKELSNEARHELQRKAFLYIRLRILDPLLFGKKFIFEKMEALISKSDYFSSKSSNPEKNKFIDNILLLDSIVVFTLCQFCKICCCGCLFQSSQIIEPGLDEESAFIQKLLNTKNVSESDIRHFNPVLQENFIGYDKSLIKFCYVVALLFVRNTTIKVRLKQALTDLTSEVQKLSMESNRWLEIAKEAGLKRNYEESLEAVTSALNYNPYCYETFAVRGIIYIRMKEYKKALLDSYISTIINPQHFTAYGNMCVCLIQENSVLECINLLQYCMKKCQFDKIKYQGTLELEKILENGTLNENVTLLNDFEEFLRFVCSLEPSTMNDNISLLKSLERVFMELCSLELNVEKDDSLSTGEIKLNFKNSLENGFKNNSTEIEDVPDLEEAQDSEDDTEVPDLSDPDLSDAPKSDESDNECMIAPIKEKPIEAKLTESKDKKVEPKSNESGVKKIETKSTVPEDTSPRTQSPHKVPDSEVKASPTKPSNLFREKDPKQLDELLKEGSQMLLDGCGHLAVSQFISALDIIDSTSKNYEASEIVCIKYACGLAYCSSGGYEDLQKSIEMFKQIIENHRNITFPAAYYGIGLAFSKLNRFKDALKYLQTVSDILEKGIRFKVYTWPGLKTVISETKSEQLKILVNCKIKECEMPPPPDAICRYEECSTQPAIYYSDADFKGFLDLQCSDHCNLQYHAVCWKALKSLKNFTDKEFLEKTCLTPDCNGIIIKVEIIDKEGAVDKVFRLVQEKKYAKPKKPKAPKRMDSKEEKRKKRHSHRESESEKTSTSDEIIPNNKENHEREKNESSLIPLSVNAEPFIIIRKEKLCDENVLRTSAKSKELKKSKPVTISFKEFCKESDAASGSSNCHASQKEDISVIEENNATTQHLPTLDCDPLEIDDFDAIKNNLYNYLDEFLTRNGPLSVKNVRLIRELETFPTEANVVIARYGGIAEFLKNDIEYRFGIVDDFFICSRNDLADAYKLSRSSGVVGADNADLLEEYADHTSSLNGSFSHIVPTLNPDAKEYRPSSVASSSTNSYTSLPEEIPPDSKTEKATRPLSSSLMSTISKLRQPIAVDDEGANNFLQDHTGGKSQKESVKTLAENCIGALKLYFSDEMESQRAYIDSCIKPYRIANAVDKSSKALQTEAIVVKTESKGTWKTDDELNDLKKRVHQLTEEKKELEVEKTLIETKLSTEMDTAAKCNKKSLVEIEYLKKELVDSNLLLQSLKNDTKSKEMKLEREHKVLMESLNAATELNSQQEKEINIWCSKNQSLQEKVKKMEGCIEDFQNETSSLKKSLDQQLEKYNSSIRNAENEKIQLMKRAKLAEVQLLWFKKEMFLSKIDSKLKEAKSRMKEIEDFLPMVNSNPLYKKNLEVLHTSISSYIKKLADIRLDLQARYDEQINAVNNGAHVESLPPIESKELPEIPCFTTQFPATNPAMNNPMAMYNAAQMMVASSHSNTPPQGIPPGMSDPVKQPPVTVPAATSVSLPKTVKENVASTFSTSCAAIPPPVSSSFSPNGGAASNKSCDNLSLELDYKGKQDSEKSASSTSLASSQGTSTKGSSGKSCDKLLGKLKSKYPAYDEVELMSFIREFRKNRKNGLSGLTIDNIVSCVGALIDAQSQPKPPPKMVEVKSKVIAVPPLNKLVSKKLVEKKSKKPPPPQPRQPVCPWGPSKSEEKNNWSGSGLEEGCIICYEEMTPSNAYKVDCGHCFHLKCIREWLNKKSDCPICRVHLLLPEDYPALK
ncbi:E3 ubiquitin-protein ligase TTC3 isoform X2 [Parasteatoda tepidariorum]|uniref:E3 ubiquitin-protein ligase TTC3 isoform X2 n=1 Tax=Parasteatoda tepidariorum TaxID=114398 RepID=UPI001C727562|nr:E3 ubiquitin-protein ligase TTC3 isoform X2 [Parasteatoda tepidariorum]